MTDRSDPDARPPLWDLRWYLWDRGFVMIGRVLLEAVVPPHAHHALQVTIGLDGAVGLRVPEGEWIVGRGMITSADEPHQFDPRGALYALIFVDPESREGRWLRRSLRGPITEIPPAHIAAHVPALRSIWEDLPNAPETAGLIHSVVTGLCTGPPPIRAPDPRVVQALEVIRTMDVAGISLQEVARAVFLSPSRFAHLFSEQLGIPFRRYVLWHRLTRALLTVGRGSTLSAAAHLCGFADAAHLTRTSVQMFGFPPSILLQGREMYELPSPFELSAATP